jgi:hypothetical protein
LKIFALMLQAFGGDDPADTRRYSHDHARLSSGTASPDVSRVGVPRDFSMISIRSVTPR